jgi:hypothetical protein
MGGPVRLLGCYSSREVDEAFAGWRDVCGRPRSVDWLLERGIRGAGSRPAWVE